MEQRMYGNLVEKKLTFKVLTTIIESSNKQYRVKKVSGKGGGD